MTTTHTPGPWRAMPDGYIQRDATMPFGGAVIAHVRHSTPDRQAANARLIAAAPELLNMCERLIGFAHYYADANALLAAQGMLDSARDLIDAAKGSNAP